MTKEQKQITYDRMKFLAKLYIDEYERSGADKEFNPQLDLVSRIIIGAMNSLWLSEKKGNEKAEEDLREWVNSENIDFKIFDYII